MAPYDGGGGGGPQGAARWDGGASEASQESTIFTTDLDGIAVTVDAQLGPIAIGAYAPHGKPAVLRAWDMKASRPLWDQLPGQSWVEGLTGRMMRVIGRNVYVANKRQLLCLDLAKGEKKWQANLSDAPGGDEEGINIADPFPPGQRGAILVPTVDHQVFAFDRDSGQPLWQRAFGDSAAELQAVAGLGAVVVRHNGTYTKADILNPAYAQSIASLGTQDWSTDLGRCKVSGRTVITVASSMGPESDQEGLFCFDAVTGQVHFFEHVEDIDTDVTPVAIGPRTFAAVNSGTGLYVGPRGRPMPPPVPNHKVVGMMQAGPVLALMLTKAHGTEVRRVVAIDPNTLAFRFDAGEAGTEPTYDYDQQMVTDGYSLVFVATPNDDVMTAELRSVDTNTGRQLWTRPAPGYRRHGFVNGAVVVHGYRQIEVLSPQNGQRIAAIP